MTFYDFYVVAVALIYLSAFFVRNIKTHLSTKSTVRGRSTKLTISLILSTLIYLLILLQIFFPDLALHIGKFTFMQSYTQIYIGCLVLLVALIIGLAALYEIGNSWRVGIRQDQKTELITTGIYNISRNPYFLSYNLLFFGFFMIYPSFILGGLVVSVAFIFHLMIKDEEQYLLKTHGKNYLRYQNRVRMYF